MLQFYLLLLLMLTIALIIPFISKNSLKESIIMSGLIGIFSLSLYTYLGAYQPLKSWVTEGKTHYELLAQYQQLGGTEGIIARIHEKLKVNSHDTKGWLILSKLYAARGDDKAAREALEKAEGSSSNSRKTSLRGA